jgi:hypothetical protein
VAGQGPVVAPGPGRGNGELVRARRLTDDEGRRLQRIVRRGSVPRAGGPRLARVFVNPGVAAGMTGGPGGQYGMDRRTPGPVPGVMIVTAWAVGLGAPLAACDRRLVMDGELAITVRPP